MNTRLIKNHQGIIYWGVTHEYVKCPDNSTIHKIDLVSWLGYPQEHNSWEPYKALRDSEQLHAYLTEHKLRFLIPQKFLK